MEVEALVSVPSSFDTMVVNPGPNSDLPPPEYNRNGSSDEVPPASAPPISGIDFDAETTSNGGAGHKPEVAVVRVQKVYRSYRTRRRLADTAVVAEELWWQAIDYARLNRSTISFFNFSAPETAASRWSRISLNASKVGKGLGRDSKAQTLAFQHWIEAIDPRHRYGHNLHKYYDSWCDTTSGQPFFYWLDVGDGKDIDLQECPRSKLRDQCVKYLGPQEREHYEYIVVEGKVIHKKTEKLLDTGSGSKWIFVMSASERLYIGEKKKGKFHHSSFLAGGTALAAGRLIATHGILKSISAYSGHYRPSDDKLDSFMSFLKKHEVNLDQVQIERSNEYSSDSYDYKSSTSTTATTTTTKVSIDPAPSHPQSEPHPEGETRTLEPLTKPTSSYKRTLSGGLQSPRSDVPKEAILQRINSKKEGKSYQLGHQLQRKWSTGAGPRIGCIADYPLELRFQALEYTELSPRLPPTPSHFRRVAGLGSPLGSPRDCETVAPDS